MKAMIVAVLLAASCFAQIQRANVMCQKDDAIPDTANGLVKIEPLTADEATQLDAARKARDEAQAALNSLVAKLQVAHGQCGQYWMEWQAGRTVDIDGHFALIRKWHRGAWDNLQLNVP
jgi:hypothetical protein